MARHAIIIGVGGTGQYVATLVKKELMEINDGKMPGNVRILAFDTMPEAEAGGNKDLPENIISIGNVQLERDVEFIPLSGNGWEIGDQVVKNEADHIGRRMNQQAGYVWFDAEEYRRSIPPALWDLAAGAGRIRQFGRLAFFMKVADRIMPRIQEAFTQVKATLDRDQELEVIVVSSFAGGTGAGMFVDTGLLCRYLGRNVSNQMIVRGFFVLPRAFANPHDMQEETRAMMARSFAAWRELDRFMNLGPDYGAHVISYKSRGTLDIQVNARPFDVCYLVDSHSANHSLETYQPKHGVFPAIANYISLILDEESGPVYSRDTRNFLRGLGNDKPGYCVFRTHTIKVPIFYDLEHCAFSFAKDLLDSWLVPVKDAKKNIIDLANNQNNEAPNTQGRDQVYPFLQATTQVENAIKDRMAAAAENVTGANYANTLLFPHISYIYGLRTNPSKFTEQLETDAGGGFSQLGEDGSLSPMTYIGRLTILPPDAGQTKVEIAGKMSEPDVQKIRTEASICVWDEVKPSDELSEHPVDGLSRFNNPTLGITAFERKHYGAGAGNKGEFGSTLEVAAKFQLKRYRELLRVWLLNTLNGTQIDARVGLAGKLGYVNDFCDELIKAVDYYRTYLESVKARRDNKALYDSALTEEASAQNEMAAWADRKCAFFFNHPRAHVKQHEYLMAVDRRLQVRKDNMVLEVMSQLSTDLLNEMRRVKASVEKWVKSLGLGGENIQGLLREMIRQDALVTSTMNQEKLDEATQFMTPEEKYALDIAKIYEEMRRISWDVDLDRDFSVQCLLRCPTKEVDDRGTAVNETLHLKSGDTQADLDFNANLFLRIARNQYQNLRDQKRVLDVIMGMKDYDSGPKLASNLHEFSDLLVEMSANANTQKHQHQIFLRTMPAENAKNPGAVSYLDEALGKLRDLFGQETTRLESQDEYKLTLLNTTYRVQDIDFQIWESLRDHYLRHIQGSKNIENATRLHIFPAECNAARYESRLTTKLDERYRPFHPKVVMLLEHAEEVSLFFRCWAYGFIKPQEVNETGEKKYVFSIPAIGKNIPQLNIVLASNMGEHDDLIHAEWPTTFEVINKFALVGHDLRNIAHQINWNHLRNAINLHESALRSTGELETKINAQMKDPQGIVPTLRGLCTAKQQSYLQRNQKLPQGGWTWEDDGQDYKDLADLAQMMYMEVLEGQSSELPSGS